MASGCRRWWKCDGGALTVRQMPYDLAGNSAEGRLGTRPDPATIGNPLQRRTDDGHGVGGAEWTGKRTNGASTRWWRSTIRLAGARRGPACRPRPWPKHPSRTRFHLGRRPVSQDRWPSQRRVPVSDAKRRCVGCTADHRSLGGQCSEGVRRFRLGDVMSCRRYLVLRAAHASRMLFKHAGCVIRDVALEKKCVRAVN